MTTLNRNFVVKNGIEVGTTANVGSTLGVTGATTLANTLAVTGNTTLSNTLTVTGLASFNGGVALGDSTSDQIAITATVNTDIIPTTTGADSLGNTSNRWLNVFANNLTLTTNVSTAGITTTTIAVSGLASLNGGVALGDATSDQISITGVVNTNIIPSATGSKDLGNTSTRWANVWANNLTVTTNVAAQGITATDMVLSGNLTVSGTTTFINTTNLDVGDNIVTLNADLPGATAPTENAGFTVNRGSAANVSFLWDETADKWTVSNTSVTGTLEVSTSVNTASYTVGSSFVANTTGVYTTGAVNAASYAIGSNFTVSSTNLNHTGAVNAASYSIGSTYVANTLGLYHTGTVNAASFSIGSSFTANDSSAVFNVSSSGNAVRITQAGTGHALVVEDEANPDATPFIIDANGRVVSGHTVVDSMWYTGSNVPRVWAVANTTNRGGFGSVNYGGPAGLSLFRSGGTTIGTEAIVASGDLVGSITYGAYDGGTSGALEVSRIDAYVDGTPGTGSMPSRLTFSTTASGAASATERMRIDSSGQVGIGGAPGAGRTFNIAKAITGATGSYGSFAFGTVQSDVTSEAVYYRTSASTAAAAFTVGSVKHYEANQGTIGAGSTVTNQYGYLAGSSLTGAGSNYGFYGNIPAAAGRWNFYAAGTANNYFAGQTQVNNTFAAGNTTITGFANISSSVNAASYSINTTFIANTTGIYHTGTANLETIGTTNIYVGNSTVNTVIANGSITVNGVNVNDAITGNAAAAYANAVSYADSAAATAYTNATNFAANASNISSGTLADARLTANVLLVSDSKTLSGNLIVSGTYFNPAANTNLLGNTTARWVLAANTGDFSGAVTMSSTLAVTGNVTGADATMTRMNLKDTAWSWNDSNTVNTIDYTNGSVQRWAPAAASNPTLTITNWPANGTLGELLIEAVALSAAGTISLNASSTWSILKSDGSYSNTFSGAGVTFTSGTDWILLWTRNAGANVYLKVMR